VTFDEKEHPVFLKPAQKRSGHEYQYHQKAQAIPLIRIFSDSGTLCISNRGSHVNFFLGATFVGIVELK
jgi:hypothetical protein